MLKSKLSLYAVIAAFFLLGVYEKRMGEVLDIPTSNKLHPEYMSISGNVLIFIAIGMFLLCSYTLSKK